MQLKEQPALGNITTYITTTEPRPLEDPDQPQKSLGEIAFLTNHSKEDYQAAPKEERSRWEKAVLYLLEQTLEKMTKVYAQYGEHSIGSHLYAALTGKNYIEWKEEAADMRERYNRIADQVMKAILLRGITLQQQHLNHLFENPLYIEEDSLGQVAYAARNPNGDLKPRKAWEDATQYLLYVWYRKVTKALKMFDQSIPWAAHLYVGITTSINDGYGAWRNEQGQLQEDYKIAALRVFDAFLSRVIALQQQQVNGQPSPEAFFPA